MVKNGSKTPKITSKLPFYGWLTIFMLHFSLTNLVNSEQLNSEQGVWQCHLSQPVNTDFSSAKRDLNPAEA